MKGLLRVSVSFTPYGIYPLILGRVRLAIAYGSTVPAQVACAESLIASVLARGAEPPQIVGQDRRP